MTGPRRIVVVRSRRVLLVDDDAHVLRVLRLRLDRNGYDVDTALDAQVALELLGKSDYAALIVAADFAPAGRGLCDQVRERLGSRTPLMLVMDERASCDAAPETALPAGVERVEQPISLRWIVARLNEYFSAPAERY